MTNGQLDLSMKQMGDHHSCNEDDADDESEDDIDDGMNQAIPPVNASCSNLAA